MHALERFVSQEWCENVSDVCGRNKFWLVWNIPQFFHVHGHVTNLIAYREDLHERAFKIEQGILLKVYVRTVMHVKPGFLPPLGAPGLHTHDDHRVIMMSSCSVWSLNQHFSPKFNRTPVHDRAQVSSAVHRCSELELSTLSEQDRLRHRHVNLPDAGWSHPHGRQGSLIRSSNRYLSRLSERLSCSARSQPPWSTWWLQSP